LGAGDIAEAQQGREEQPRHASTVEGCGPPDLGTPSLTGGLEETFGPGDLATKIAGVERPCRWTAESV
jgi:hypothetical protein